MKHFYGFLILLLFSPFSNAACFVTDQKKNCTNQNIRQSYCYTVDKKDIYGQIQTCTVPGTIALTFDDGPANHTDVILNILKNYNMSATFFLIGKKMRGKKEIIQRIIDEGHQIGSHTFSHRLLTNISLDQVYYELVNWEKVLVGLELNGSLSDHKIPNYFRPPHGALNNDTARIINSLGYLSATWGVLTEDTSKRHIVSPVNIINAYYSWFGGNNTSNVNTSALTLIVQQHDTIQATIDSFEYIASYLYNNFVTKGVKFVTLAECLNNTVPAYRDNPRFIADPECLHGIYDNRTKACCDSDCTICGGNNCGTRLEFDSASRCCVNDIVLANVSCNITVAPCMVHSGV